MEGHGLRTASYEIADGNVRKVVDEMFIGEIGWISKLALQLERGNHANYIHIFSGTKAILFSLDYLNSSWFFSRLILNIVIFLSESA